MFKTLSESSLEKLYWEDFPVGSAFEVGRKTVSREEIVFFATQFDPQDFHLDEEAAASSQFGGLIASGWHICAMTMRMVCDGFLLRAAGMGSPGLEGVRWKIPVRPGDTLHVRVLVIESRPSSSRPEVGITRWRWDVMNQRNECVTEIESTGMFQRRPV